MQFVDSIPPGFTSKTIPSISAAELSGQRRVSLPVASTASKVIAGLMFFGFGLFQRFFK